MDRGGSDAVTQNNETTPNSWDITRAQITGSSFQQSDPSFQHDESPPQSQATVSDDWNERGQQEQHAVSDDPLVILALDVKNAFNTLKRQHLCDFLQKGTQYFTTLPEDGQHNMPVGWDLLWRHIQVHYGCKGILKYYHAGQVSHVLSQSGVQQGDPLGSTLFALAIHPILLEIASTFDIVVAAYADNVVFTGRLSEVIRAQDLYRT